VFVTNHALAGAAIGALVRRPVPAFVVGVASHVLMDMTPTLASRTWAMTSS
jgi:hypothetical protein